MANLTYAGDTYSIAVTITDEVTAAAVDVSAAAISWTLSRTPGGAALLTKTKSAGQIAVSGASNNIATVTIAAGDTADLSGTYYHEMQVTDASSNVFTVVQERLVVQPETIT